MRLISFRTMTMALPFGRTMKCLSDLLLYADTAWVSRFRSPSTCLPQPSSIDSSRIASAPCLLTVVKGFASSALRSVEVLASNSGSVERVLRVVDVGVVMLDSVLFCLLIFVVCSLSAWIA